MRGATGDSDKQMRIISISIHAPREGCDEIGLRVVIIFPAISIHAPREGCDHKDLMRYRDAMAFQSTHPVRGATHYEIKLNPITIFQSTHPVRGAT